MSAVSKLDLPDQQVFAADMLIQLSADIVASYVSNNEVSAEDLPALIKSVHETVRDIIDSYDDIGNLTPAIPIKDSVTDEHIICLEDGKKLKMLKRYLRTHYSMTPDEYRVKWSLPPDYPMVAANYAKKRSELAKKIGLGRSRN